MTWLLLCLLPNALLYVDGGQRRYVLHALLALLADVVVAHTAFARLVEPPLRREWTVSQVLRRICGNPLHPKHAMCLALAREINLHSPTGKHIPNA